LASAVSAVTEYRIIAGDQSLDTPLIAVDLDLLERNMAEMAAATPVMATSSDTRARRPPASLKIKPSSRSRLINTDSTSVIRSQSFRTTFARP